MRYFPYFLFIALFLVQWSLLFVVDHPEWDGVFYYSYARSIVVDNDLHLANDIQLSYTVTSDRFEEKAFHTITTPTGYIDSPFAIGTAVLWLPWLFLTHLFANATGFEPFVLVVQSVLPAFAGVVAYVLSFRITKQIVSKKVACVAVATLMWTTPLVYYQFVDSFFSHTLSALMATICIGYWWRKQDQSATFAISLGMLIGCAALVRWQNSMYLLLIGVPAALETVKNFRTLPLAVRNVLLGIAGFLAVMTIQFAMWFVFYGSWITIPQGDSFMNWSAPRLWPTLFSTYRGLLFWMPIFFPALFGLLILCRRRLIIGLPLLSILLFEVYVHGSTYDWFAGGGFGPRRFTSELSILVIGYAVFLDALPVRWQLTALLGVLLALPHWILLRFGIFTQIGGRIVAFNPEYRWIEDSPALFLSKVMGYVPMLWRDPYNFWLATNAPLDRLIRGLPLRWLLFGLVVSGVLWGAIYWIGSRRFLGRYPVRNILLSGILVGGSVLWMLIFA